MKKIHIARVRRHLSIVLIIIMLFALNIDVLAVKSSSEEIETNVEPVICDICGEADGHLSDCTTLCTCEATDSGHIEGCPLYTNNDGIADITETTETFVLSSKIYTSSDHSDTPTVLGSGTEIYNWNHGTDRYLSIDIADLNMEASATYQLVVTMQPILYASYIYSPNGATYEFQPNPPISVNTDSTYTCTEGSSGTIVYTLNSGVNTTQIEFSFRYDNALWNKLANTALGDGTTPLMTVSFVKISGDTETVLYKSELKNAYTGTGMSTNGSVGLRLESRPGAASSYGSITGGYGDRVTISADQMGSQNYDDGHFYKELSVVVKLPCYIDANNVSHYMILEDFSFRISSGTADYTIEYSDDKSTAVITASNIYFQSNNLIKFYLDYPESVSSLDDIKFTSGSVTISRSNANIASASINVTMKAVEPPKVIAGTSSGAVNTLNLDIVQRLGTYGLNNKGGTSGAYVVSLEFDANNTHNMHVTTIQLMADIIQEYITVTYTLVDENGNLYQDNEGKSEFTYDVKNPFYNYNKDIDAGGTKALFYRGMLPQEQRNYYFKTISYDIKSIPAHSPLYHTGAPNASYSGGSYWGYVDTTTPANPLITKVTVLDVDTNTYPTSLQAAVKVVLDSTMNVPYGMINPTVSTTEVIEAGQSFTIGGTVTVVGYPYTSNSRLSKIQLGVLLPAGITINEETIKLKGKIVDVTVERLATPVDGKYLWIVHFPETTEIGHYSENLGPLPDGSSMTFSMTLNTDVTVASHKLNMEEIVFAAGYKANNGSGGTYAYYLADEPQGYDLNGTGVVDKVAKFKDNKTIIIQAAPAQLSITDGARKADTSASATSQLDHYADSVIYELDIMCENGGSADDFFYFIPVPKASDIDSDLTTASVVGLEMHGPATLTTSGTPLQILYTTETGLTYQSAQSSSVNWVSADKITDWSSVTLMKIILADGYSSIENGSINTISVPLYFAQKNSLDQTVSEYDYASYAGMKIKWNSKGYYHYTRGANIFAGNIPTAGTTVTLQYTAWEQKEIVLTAAKDIDPSAKTKEITVEIPFKNEQVYTLAAVTVKDVTLVSSSTSISDRNSNTHFGITVSINDDPTHYDILTEKIETTVGSSPANSSTKLTFTVYNGNAISDIVKERYVEIKLVGNNGVIIPVKIIINREMSLAGEAESAIQSGKEYIQVLFSDDNNDGKPDPISVSSDSAFTAQFVVPGLIPDNYSTRKLTFSNPTAGSTIVMIDWTNSSAPRYYHYTLTGNDTELELTEFTEMGNSSRYQYPSGDTPVEERFLFIVDLPDSGTASSGTIGLITTPKQDAPLYTELSYNVTAKRTFSFTCDDTSAELEEPFIFNYATSASDTGDSRYLGRQFSIAISGTGLSSDSKLIVGDSAYYLNSDGMFIIPIGELKSGSCSMALYSSENTAVELSASLWVSANADALNPFLGAKVSADIPISISAKRVPSVNVVSMSNRVLTPKDLNNPIDFVYETEDVSNLTVTLEVQVKEGNGYRTITTVLNTVNGAASQAGVYTISTNGGTLKLKFSGQTEAGTYRLVIKVSDNSETILEVPYNFIVTE